VHAVERALAELRRACPVLLTRAGSGEAALVLAAEESGAESLDRLAALGAKQPLLLLTARRARALGLAPDALGEEIAALAPEELTEARLAELVDPTSAASARTPTACSLAPGLLPLARSAVELTKLAHLLPAALLAPLPAMRGEEAPDWAHRHDLLAVEAEAVARYRLESARRLTIVAEARVPLVGAEKTRVVAFRPSDGGAEHLALVIGEPRRHEPVLLRVHSECFTGDLLGSLRCDCGEQLRGAVRAIGEAGAGILLYLAQEGRGIGLVNKLRAYVLQDRGADTLDANEALGFGADERIYLPAAEMLRQLGYRRVRLMTNNPEKMAALAHCGISVEERVAHSFPSNSHNDFSLATKRRRFGHDF
jgi:GTP cyclohydrolase II